MQQADAVAAFPNRDDVSDSERKRGLTIGCQYDFDLFADDFDFDNRMQTNND